MLELFPFSLTAEESGGAILHETRLAFAKTRDIRRNKLFSADTLPWFAGAGCSEGSLALNAAGEGLLFHDH